MICFECGEPASVLAKWNGNYYAYCKECVTSSKTRLPPKPDTIAKENKAAEEALANLFR